MIRRTPISTLFPYTTLFRSASCSKSPPTNRVSPWTSRWRRWERRSEEHTSELQSRPHLVCRLLLEKKNQLTYLNIAIVEVHLSLLGEERTIPDVCLHDLDIC